MHNLSLLHKPSFVAQSASNTAIFSSFTICLANSFNRNAQDYFLIIISEIISQLSFSFIPIARSLSKENKNEERKNLIDNGKRKNFGMENVTVVSFS